MTYVAFNRLPHQPAAVRSPRGIGGLLLLAWCKACAPLSIQDGGENCLPSLCPPTAGALRVVSVTPSDGATDAEPAGTIAITFNREPDPATPSVKNIAILDRGTPITGTITCDGRQVVFTPDAKLSLLARYTVLVRSTVTDLDGVPLQHDFTSGFTVRDGTWTRVANPSGVRSWLSGLTVDAEGQFLLGLWDQVPSVRRYSAGMWRSATQVGCEGCFDYLLRGNARGDALAVAVDGNGSAIARQLREGTWQAQSIDVAGLDGYLPQARVTAAVAPNGDAHVLFVDDELIRVRQTNRAGVWSGGLVSPTKETMHFQPVLAFDAQGRGLAAWIAHDEDYDRSGVHFTRIGGNALVVESIPNSTQQGQSLGQVALAMTSNGDAVTVWPGPGGLLTSHYKDGAWSTTRLVNVAETVACTPPAVVNDGDEFVAAWGQHVGDSPSSCSVYSSRWHEGTWSAPELVGDARTSSAEAPLLAADPHGNLMLVWRADTLASFARFDGLTTAWTAPASAFDAAEESSGAIAMATNGVVMAAYEHDGIVTSALFK